MPEDKHAVLLVLCLIFITNNVNADLSLENTSGLLSKLLGKRTPLVVVINNYSTSKNLRSSDDQDQADVSSDFAASLNDVLNTKNAFRYMSDILRSTGDENDIDVKNTNEKYARALRSRCEKVQECQQKCKKPKKKDNCQKSCQKTYDQHDMCPPPKFPSKSNKEVYEYHKKNMNKNDCGNDSDECKSKSNECDDSDGCKSKSNECEESDECGKAKDSCESSGGCN